MIKLPVNNNPSTTPQSKGHKSTSAPANNIASTIANNGTGNSTTNSNTANSTSPITTNSPTSSSASQLAASASSQSNDTANNNQSLTLLNKLLATKSTPTAEVKSSQLLTKNEQQLLVKTNPSLAEKLNQQFIKNSPTVNNTISLDATLKANNLQNSLYLSKLIVEQKLITVITSNKLNPGEKLQLNSNNQQLSFSKAPLNTTAKTAIIESLRQSLPQQQTTSQLLNATNALLKLPITVQQQLLNNTTIQQLQTLTSSAIDKNQTNAASIKNSINNSGVFLESKLNQQQNISSDIRRILSNTNHSLNSKNDLQTSQLNKSTSNHINTNGNNVTPQSKNTLSISNEKLIIDSIKSNISTSETNKPLDNKVVNNIIIALINNSNLPTSINPTALQNSHLPQQINTLLQLLGIKMTSSESKDIRSTKDIIAKKLSQMINGVQDKIRLNQIRSLGLESNNHETPTKGIQLNTEIPLRWGEQTLPLHIDIREHREKEKPSGDENKADKKEQARRWQAFLSFDLPGNEKLHTQITLIESTLSAIVWAESHALCEQAKQHMTELRKSLTDNGVIVEDITCIEGKPPTQELSLDYNLVDIKT